MPLALVYLGAEEPFSSAAWRSPSRARTWEVPIELVLYFYSWGSLSQDTIGLGGAPKPSHDGAKVSHDPGPYLDKVEIYLDFVKMYLDFVNPPLF